MVDSDGKCPISGKMQRFGSFHPQQLPIAVVERFQTKQNSCVQCHVPQSPARCKSRACWCCITAAVHSSCNWFVSERRVPQSVSIFSCCATKKTENRAHTGDPSVPAAPSRDPVSQLHFAVSLLEKNVKRNIRVIHNVTSRPSRTSERLQR